MTIFKSKNKRLFVDTYNSIICYWIPTIATMYTNKEKNNTKWNFTEGDNYECYRGYIIDIELRFLIFALNIAYCWSVERSNCELNFNNNNHE